MTNLKIVNLVASLDLMIKNKFKSANGKKYIC